MVCDGEAEEEEGEGEEEVEEGASYVVGSESESMSMSELSDAVGDDDEVQPSTSTERMTSGLLDDGDVGDGGMAGRSEREM